MGWRHIGHLGVARENRMLVGSIACRCAIGLTRLKSDDYTCRTVRKWLVDAGSIPASSTNTQSPTRLSWGFFSSVGASCPVLLRVRAETCGLRPLRGQTGSAPDSLSSGHFSQYPRRPEMGRSPQGSLSMAKKINNLRVDESIGLFATLVGDQKSQPSGFGCGGLRKAGAGQEQSLANGCFERRIRTSAIRRKRFAAR